MASCPFCKGKGVTYRPWGREECSPCNGTGQNPLPPMESWRETRLRLRREADAREEAAREETTRAATEGGPTREHGNRDKVEEDSRPRTGPASVPAGPNTPTTPKE